MIHSQINKRAKGKGIEGQRQRLVGVGAWIGAGNSESYINGTTSVRVDTTLDTRHFIPNPIVSKREMSTRISENYEITDLHVEGGVWFKIL